MAFDQINAGVSYTPEHHKLARQISYLAFHHGDEHGLLAKAALMVNHSAVAHGYGRYKEAHGYLLTAGEHLKAAANHLDNVNFQKNGQAPEFEYETPQQEEERDSRWSAINEDTTWAHHMVDNAIKDYANRIRNKRG